jgi:hypothetical protein
MSSYDRNGYRRGRVIEVPTSNASSYKDGKGKYFIMSPNVRRTFGDEACAVEHATNYIRAGNSDEFLIVKVVGRVRKKPIPVEYEVIGD